MLGFLREPRQFLLVGTGVALDLPKLLLVPTPRCYCTAISSGDAVVLCACQCGTVFRRRRRLRSYRSQWDATALLEVVTIAVELVWVGSDGDVGLLGFACRFAVRSRIAVANVVAIAFGRCEAAGKLEEGLERRDGRGDKGGIDLDL